MTRARPGGIPATIPDLPGAACRGEPLEWFFPDQEDGRPAPFMVEMLRGTARLYCGTCPARVACRAAGESMSDGLWGGVWRRPKGDPIDLLAVAS